MSLDMHAKGARYHSFLLRLWRTDNLEEVVWHIMLEDTGTGTRYSFSDFPELTAFLRATIVQPPPEADWHEEGEASR